MMEMQFDKTFPKPETAEWIAEIHRTVKRPEDLEKLVWQNENGFVLNAFYREENTEELKYKGFNPLQVSNTWEIRQPVYTGKIMAANQSALLALENGADSLEFRGDSFDTDKEMQALFKDIHLDWIAAHFDFGESNIALLYMLSDYYSNMGYAIENMQGSINIDPIRDLMRQGNYEFSQADTIRILHAVLRSGQTQLPGYKLLGVNTLFYNNSGANAVQELAFGIAQAVEYLGWLTEQGLDPGFVMQQFHFNMGIGSDYFTEIAKFRAFRVLWPSIAEEYTKEFSLPYVNAVSSDRNKTMYDPHNNLLRNTTEAMSAAIGGVHSITLNPFDAIYKNPDEFSYRMARNIQLLIKEEAYLHKVADPSAGAYYIEMLTEKIADQAWELFREVQREGGLIQALKNKMVQRHIESNANKQKEAFRDIQKILVGINKYPNTNEKITGKYVKVPEKIFFKENLEVMPIREERIAEPLEIARLKKEEENS